MVSLNKYLTEATKPAWKAKSGNVHILDSDIADIEIVWQQGDKWKIRFGKMHMTTKEGISLEEAKRIALKNTIKYFKQETTRFIGLL